MRARSRAAGHPALRPQHRAGVRSHRGIDQFVDEYRHGRTPVPAWPAITRAEVRLAARARAGVGRGRRRHRPLRARHPRRRERALPPVAGRDERKDQSDFLWPLTQEQLGGARGFPVGELTKDEVRAHARRLGLATADKPESQEICFIPDDDYRGFLPPRVLRCSVRARSWIGGGLRSAATGPRQLHGRPARGLGWRRAGASTSWTSIPGRTPSWSAPPRTSSRTRLVAEAVNFIAGSAAGEPLPFGGEVRHRHTPGGRPRCGPSKEEPRRWASTSPSAPSRPGNRSSSIGVTWSSAVESSHADPSVVDSRPNCVIVFTILHDRTRESRRPPHASA